MARTQMNPIQRERRRKIKKMTGRDSDHISCTGCHREFTNYEIDHDKVIAVIGRTASVAYCEDCFRKFFAGGG